MFEKIYHVLVLILLVVLVLAVGAMTFMTYQTNTAYKDLAAQNAERAERCKQAIQDSLLSATKEYSLELYPFNIDSDYQKIMIPFYQFELLMAQDTILAGCLP
jgi:flagellar basal body-associated protein FliL